MLNKCTVVSISLVLWVGLARCEELNELERVVVTASKVPVPLEQVGSSVTVVSREQIENRQAVFVGDLLRDVPGIAVSRSGGVGAFTQIRVRGAEANQTLILIDGIEANDPGNGSEFDFAHLLASDVERIEIIRGPQSSLWGSDALAGVINIITRQGEDPIRFDAGSFAGSFSTFQGRAGISGSGKDYQFALRGTYFDSQGNNVAERGGEQDAYRNESLNVNAGLSPFDELRFNITYRHTRGKREFDPAPFPSFSPVDGDRETEVNQTFGRLQGQLNLFDEAWQQIAGASITSTDNDSFADGVEDTSTQGKKFRVDYQTNLIFETEFIAKAVHNLSLALEHEREDFDQRGPGTVFGDPNQDRDISRASYIAEYRLGLWERLFLAGAIRNDDNQGFKDATTYRLTGAFVLPQWNTKLHSAFGTGIKNPTFTDLFGFFRDPVFIGNPNLEPERSEGWELGIEQRFFDGKVLVGATYFREKLRDEIDGVFFDPTLGDGGAFTAVNVNGTSQREGAEFNLQAELFQGLNLGGSYAYVDSTEPSAGRQVREIRRPEHVASLNLNYRFLQNKANINFGLDYTGDQKDRDFSTFPATLVRLDDYLVINAAASYHFNSLLTIFARVENLFDEDYQDVFGFETPGLGVYGGVRIALTQ